MAKTTKSTKKVEEKKVKKTILETATPAIEPEIKAENAPVTDSKTETKKVIKKRSQKYLDAAKAVDKNKYYSVSEAVKLVKSTSFSKFEGKVEAHSTIFDVGTVGEIVFPHLETASKKIVVLNDTVLKDIKEGKINFDVLVTSPALMPKLLPFAKLLGPKGLMPNPKNGTLTDKPEEAIKKLSVAKTVIKTEKKAPVLHLVVGKITQPEAEIEANIKELIKTIGVSKIKKLTICATMGPGIKINLTK